MDFLICGFGQFLSSRGFPEGAIDAININKRELIYYYQYDPRGKQELKNKGILLE